MKTSPVQWTARQQREADFYRDYAHRQSVDAVDFGPVQGDQSRPWNPYWYVYETVRNQALSPSQRLLDFGCGIGLAAIRFASLGFQVHGFDLSEDNLQIARRLAKRYQYESRCRFRSMVAEHLVYPDDYFDVVVGIDILHHVDIPLAISQAHRVLKPGGMAIFKEHVEVPVLDAIRNTPMVRAVAPNETSLDHHITDDERKLNQQDLDVIHDHFESVQTQRFTLLSRFDRLIPGCTDSARGRLQRLDYRLMGASSRLARLGGTVVLICRK